MEAISSPAALPAGLRPSTAGFSPRHRQPSLPQPLFAGKIASPHLGVRHVLAALLAALGIGGILQTRHQPVQKVTAAGPAVTVSGDAKRVSVSATLDGAFTSLDMQKTANGWGTNASRNGEARPILLKQNGNHMSLEGTDLHLDGKKTADGWAFTGKRGGESYRLNFFSGKGGWSIDANGDKSGHATVQANANGDNWNIIVASSNPVVDFEMTQPVAAQKGAEAPVALSLFLGNLLP